ncbi:MAG: hypothetical protein R3B45_12495 [Bdellovibrionota bacterium]
MLTFHFLLRPSRNLRDCHGFKNYPQCTSSTPPVIFETLPSCDFQVFVSRYENETSTRPSNKPQQCRIPMYSFIGCIKNFIYNLKKFILLFLH